MKRGALFLLFSLCLTLTCNAQQQRDGGNPLRVARLIVSNVEVTLNYYDQRLIALDNQIQSVTAAGFKEMVNLFGGLPKDANGAPYKTFRINLHHGLPEANTEPNIITISLNEELETKPFFGYITWKMALVHEMFHFWNAKTFRYASGREQWFNEGVTEYYAFRIAIKLGLIEREKIPSRLGLPIGYYLGDSGTGTLSMSEAGDGDAKFKHYFLIYCGGLVAGMVLDYDTRMATNNTKSLDDLMRAMYLKFNSTDRTYTNAAVLAELNKITGKDHSQFFSHYILGPEIIPVGQYFSIADLYFYFLNQPKRFDPNSQQGMVLRDMFYLNQK